MGQTGVKNNRRIFSISGGDPSIPSRVTTLENNEYKILYFASISAATGTITIPTGATVLLDQFYSGGDAIVETLINGQPSEQSPVTSGGAVVSVSSFDTSGNYTLSGTPSSYPVALVYILKIKAVDYQNLVTANIMAMESLSFDGGSFNITFDGQGSVVMATSNSIVSSSANGGTITSFAINSDVSGSIEIDMLKNGVSMIGAGTKLDLIAASSDSGAISGWTSNTFNINDKLEWVITSATTITKVWLTVKFDKI